MKISWFSAGVSSAVATKLSTPDLIIYNPVADMHPDTDRFISDCETWFGKKVWRLASRRVSTVEQACRLAACITIPNSFTACTKHLKIAVRKEWEHDNPGPHEYIWGLDCGETRRAEGIVKRGFPHDHSFPLIDKCLSKADAHGILAKAGIRRPAMYDEGYPNNNCLGCVRGGMGYWNKIRREYPSVFEARLKLERIIGHSILKECYLDELSPERGRGLKPIVQDCGVMCEIVREEAKAREYLSGLADGKGGGHDHAYKLRNRQEAERVSGRGGGGSVKQ